MRSVFLLALVGLLAAAAVVSAAGLPSVSVSSSQWSNEDVMRSIDLRTHIEEVTLNIKAKNKASSAASSFIVAIPGSKSARLAFLEGSVGKTKLISREVALTGAGVEKAGANATFFQIDLNKPVAAGESLSLTVFQVFTRTQVPYPDMIEQADNQLVLYEDSSVWFSPYNTESQETLIRLFNNKAESYTKKHGRKTGDEIRYGPFTSTINAFDSKPITIHSVNNAPFVTFNSLSKDIEVSHWGNVAVQDNYILTHTGAKLKGAFIRGDYERSRHGEQAPASFRTLIAELPRTAKDIYYRDVIGNVSTSHVRRTRELTRMEVDPRFPMFGGWESDFHIGYNLPSQHYLSVDDSDSDLYVLNISFAAPFSSAAIDSLAVRVILPEGARDIVWRTPFDIDRATYTEFKTYLDTSGRPTLILQKENCVKYHQQHFQVAYRFDRSSILREPLLITAAVFLTLLIVIIFSHADLRIVDERDSSAAVVRASPITTRRTGTDLGETVQQILENLLAEPNGLLAVSQERNVEKQTLVTSLVKEIAASLKTLETEDAEAFGSIVTTLTNSLSLLAKSSKKYVGATNAAEIKASREQLAQAVEQIHAQAEKLASL